MKNKYFSIKIHKALMSDPANLHDHPWNYLSIILWGGYHEETIHWVPRIFNPNEILSGAQASHIRRTRVKWYGPGSVLFRKGDSPHKLIIPQNKYCLSFIITMKRYRKWGFINEQCEWHAFDEESIYN